MKLLKKVLLINWHSFSKELIEIGNINFLTGKNAVGKSTIVDAIQLVVLGDTRGTSFNKAASEKSGRTVISYLKGEVGSDNEGNKKYLREGDFASYVALEFYDDVNNIPFVIGLQFDVSGDKLYSHQFIYDGTIPEQCFVANNKAMEYKTFKDYVSEKEYPETGLDRKKLETAFLGKKNAYEQKNTDILDKQKLSASYEKAMEQQKEQLQLLGHSLEEMLQKEKTTGCIRTEMEQMLVLKKEVFEIQNQLLLLENEKKTLEAVLNKTMGSIQHAKQMVEEKYGQLEMLEIPAEQIELFVSRQKEQLKAVETQMRAGQKQMRDLEEQCYALKAMAQDMERMMKSAGITPENITECLETGMSLKEQYEDLRQAYEKIVKEEAKKLESVEKEKQLLTATLEKMGAYELSEEIKKNLDSPQNELQIKEQMDSLKSVTECLELEKNRIGKDMDSLQGLKDQFEAQCLQNCLNIKEELDRLQKLSKISMDQQMISMITLQVPYIKEELYGDAMSAYIDNIIRQVENFDSQAERLNFIRNQLAFKRLFSVIVTNMDAIRLTLYKRERMKEQSRYLKYEEAVGSTGQSQGIYIQFLVAIINYISSINSGNADPLELKKVIFIDNPFGAAKDVYIWEPIFKLLKSNNVQLIVPARGATPAIT